MKRATIGVIGHVDHGKTALVRALTGIETDKLAEERQRGISIALGFAHFSDGDGEIDLIDMPGHENFVRTMISGATGIDAVLIAVAANEGVQPQTIEHADIAALLGITQAVVAVTKAGLASQEDARAVAGAAEKLLRERGIGVTATIVTDAVSGTGIDALRCALGTVAATAPERGNDGDPWLPVDRAFAIAGHGPVVTGTLRGGAVHPGDKLLLFPRQRPVRVRALQVHGKPVSEGLPGQRVALGLRDVPVSKLARGMQLGPAVGFEQTDWFTIAIRAVADAPPLDNGMRLRALVGTSEIDTRLRLLDRDTLQPGDEGFAQLRLSVPLAVPAREHVVLRIASPARTVAGGRILEPLVLRRRRNDPAILDRLRAMRDLSPEALLLDAIESAGQRGMALTDLARLCAMRPDVVASRLASEPVLITASGLVFAEAQAERIASRIPIMLELKPSGMSRKQLLSAFDGARAPLVDAAADRLVETKRIERRGRQFVLPDPERDAQAVEDEATLARHLAETLRTSGLQPPNPGALLADAATRRAARRLIGDGIVIRAVDRAKGRELLFHRDAIAQARAILGPLLAQGDGLLVTSIAAALGVSRKFAMPLLDHLDKIRFTRREGNMRFAGDALQGATDD